MRPGIDMTAKQFKGHVRSHLINYMTRSTSKPSNRRLPWLNLPQCSFKLASVVICLVAVFFQAYLLWSKCCYSLLSRINPFLPSLREFTANNVFPLNSKGKNILWERFPWEDFHENIFNLKHDHVIRLCIYFSNDHIYMATQSRLLHVWIRVFFIMRKWDHCPQIIPFSGSIFWLPYHSIVLSFLLRATRNTKQWKIRL